MIFVSRYMCMYVYNYAATCDVRICAVLVCEQKLIHVLGRLAVDVS